jgi:hypothetical protein
MWGEIIYILVQQIYDGVPLVMLFLQHDKNFKAETELDTTMTMSYAHSRNLSRYGTNNLGDDLKGSLI